MGTSSRPPRRGRSAAKPRVHVIHWRESELPERVARLERAGYRVEASHQEGGEACRRVRASPPDAVVIDLGRLPSHGRHAAIALRRWPATRGVPLVFVEGDRDAVAAAKRVLPDVPHAAWASVGPALVQAMARRSERPHVPPASAGATGTPLPKKLGVRGGETLALLGAPGGYPDALGELPSGVTVRRAARGSCDVIVLFAATRAVMRRRLPAARRAMTPGGRLWLAWPKKTSGVRTDLRRELVRPMGLGSGLVDDKVCSIDETWSGLRFVERKKRA